MMEFSISVGPLYQSQSSCITSLGHSRRKQSSSCWMLCNRHSPVTQWFHLAVPQKELWSLSLLAPLCGTLSRSSIPLMISSRQAISPVSASSWTPSLITGSTSADLSGKWCDLATTLALIASLSCVMLRPFHLFPDCSRQFHWSGSGDDRPWAIDTLGEPLC